MEEKISSMSVSMFVWSLCINVSVLREHQRIPTVIKLLKLFSLKIEVSVQWYSADLLFLTPKLLVYLASHLTNDPETKPTAGVLSKEIHTECTHHPWPKYYSHMAPTSLTCPWPRERHSMCRLRACKEVHPHKSLSPKTLMAPNALVILWKNTTWNNQPLSIFTLCLFYFFKHKQ